MAYKDIMKSESNSDLKNSLKKRSDYHKTRQYGLSPFCSLGEGMENGQKIYFDGMKLIDIYKTIRKATFDTEPGDSLAVKYKDTPYGGNRECRMTQSFTPGQWKYMEGKHRGWYTTEDACMFLSYTARDHRDSYLEVLGNEDVNLTEQDSTDKSFEKQKRKNTREAERIYGDISQRPLIYVYSPRHSELPQSTFAVCILMKYILVDVDDNGNYSFDGETCISSYDSFNDRAARNSVVKLASMSNSPTAVIGVATPWILYYEGDKVEARELKEYDNDSAFAELVYCKGDTDGMNKFKAWCDTNLDKETILDNIETEIRRKFKVKKRSNLKVDKSVEPLDEQLITEAKEFLFYQGYEMKCEYDIDTDEGTASFVVELYADGKEVRDDRGQYLSFANFRQAREWIDKHPLPTSMRYKGYLITWGWEMTGDKSNIKITRDGNVVTDVNGNSPSYKTVKDAMRAIDELVAEADRKAHEMETQRRELMNKNQTALDGRKLVQNLKDRVKDKYKGALNIVPIQPVPASNIYSSDFLPSDDLLIIAHMPNLEYVGISISDDLSYADEEYSVPVGSDGCPTPESALNAAINKAKKSKRKSVVVEMIYYWVILYSPSQDKFYPELAFEYKDAASTVCPVYYHGVTEKEVNKFFNPVGNRQDTIDSLIKKHYDYVNSKYKVLSKKKNGGKNNSKLTEAPDMFGYMTDDEMDADDQARRDRLERELADRRARTVDKRTQWQQHKPTYDEAVKRFQNSAGKVLEQLAHKFESGKLLQWSAYETPLVEIYKQHGSDYVVFKPIGDNKKNWLDTIVYSLSTGKVHFNYYKDNIGRYLDAYDQVAKLVDSCVSVVSDWVDFIEDQNKQSTDKAINSFLGDFVDNPSNIDCAFDCSNPGHYLHGCRYYIFSVDGKVYHYEDYDSGAYTQNHVHQIRCFDRIDIKNYMWNYDNPVLEKIDPSRVGLSVKGDLYGSQYLLGGVVRLSDLTSGRGTPTDKVVRLGYYTSPDNVRHSVYFYSNERDTTKAQSQLAKLVPQGSVQVGVARQTSETDAKKNGFTLIESSHRKKKKGIHINKNAGNVEHNINMFNMANSPVGGPCNNPISGPMGGNVCCESIEPMSQDEYESFLKKSAVECYRGFDILHSTWHIKSGDGKEDVWDSYAFIFNGKFFPDEVYYGLDSLEKTRERIDQIIRGNPGRFGALEYDRDAATKFEKEFDVMSPQEVADTFGREVKDGGTTYSPNKKYEGLDDDFDMFMRGI